MSVKLLILFLCMASSMQAQPITRYYNYQWKECDISLARFVSVKMKTDSGWRVEDSYLATQKLQMLGLYKDQDQKIQHGVFTYFYPNRQVSATGTYRNGKKDGLWLTYHYNGMMKDSAQYEAGQPIETHVGWHSNGMIADSVIYGVNGLDVYISWFDNGNPSAAGRKLGDKMEGKWQFFHKNGKLAALEEYKAGVLINKTYYDETGTQLADTTNHDHESTFKDNSKKWKNYVEGALVFPRGVKLVNTDVITVVIKATINEQGEVEDAYTEVPFNSVFDDEALRVMKRSPKWNPAVEHNRKIKSYIRQPISFSQQ